MDCGSHAMIVNHRWFVLSSVWRDPHHFKSPKGQHASGREVMNSWSIVAH